MCLGSNGLFHFLSVPTRTWISGGGQLLISRSQGPISRVSGIRVPCPTVASANSSGPSSKVLGSQVLGSRCPRVPGPSVLGLGSQVLILDYAICKCIGG